VERSAVAAPQLELDRFEAVLARQPGEQRLQVLGRRQPRGQVATLGRRGGREAEDAREGRVAIDDLAVRTAEEGSGEVLFEEAAVALLALRQRGGGLLAGREVGDERIERPVPFLQS